MLLRSDDGLHRVTGRWIEARGTPMGGFRYVAWYIAAPAFLVYYLVLVNTIGRVTPAVIYGLVAAALTGKYGADQVGGEYTLWSWITLFRSEFITLRRHYRALLDTYLPHLRRRAQAPIRSTG